MPTTREPPARQQVRRALTPGDLVLARAHRSAAKPTPVPPPLRHDGTDHLPEQVGSEYSVVGGKSTLRGVQTTLDGGVIRPPSVAAAAVQPTAKPTAEPTNSHNPGTTSSGSVAGPSTTAAMPPPTVPRPYATADGGMIPPPSAAAAAVQPTAEPTNGSASSSSAAELSTAARQSTAASTTAHEIASGACRNRSDETALLQRQRFAPQIPRIEMQNGCLFLCMLAFVVCTKMGVRTRNPYGTSNRPRVLWGHCSVPSYQAGSSLATVICFGIKVGRRMTD